MNKADLIEMVAETGDLSNAAAGRVVDALLDGITNALKQGDAVTIVGFGTFKAKERKARTGINPKTKEPIQIPASIAASFKAGKALKDALNQRPVIAEVSQYFVDTTPIIANELS